MHHAQITFKKYMPNNSLKHLSCTPKTSTQPSKKESQLPKFKLVRRKCAIIKMRQKVLPIWLGDIWSPNTMTDAQCNVIPPLPCPALWCQDPQPPSFPLLTALHWNLTWPKSHHTLFCSVARHCKANTAAFIFCFPAFISISLSPNVSKIIITSHFFKKIFKHLRK